MGKTFKDMKKEGKVTLDGPKVKDRIPFAPATQRHKAGKGKGSYNRKNKPPTAVEEAEEMNTDEVDKKVEELTKRSKPKYPFKKVEELVKRSKPKYPFKKGEELAKRSKPKYPFKKGEKSEAKKADLERMREENKNKKLSPPKQNKLEGGLQKRLKKELNESASIIKFIEAIMTEDHAKAHKYLKDTINKKIQEKISQEIEKPLF